MSDQPFEGQRVVVTGGGTGIGKHAAVEFAKLGAASVIITGRRKERLDEVAELHPNIVPVAADVTTAEGAQAVADAVETNGGKLDVLVHNAGIFRNTLAEYFDEKASNELLNINLLGPVRLTGALYQYLSKPGGNIVFVSSVAGHNPEPGAAMYAASKAGMHSLTLTWARELAPLGIRVNAVAPAGVRTEVYAANGLNDEETDAIFATLADIMPLGRTGTVEDITPWITLLASPASSWVTGQIITIDGGQDLTAGTDHLFMSWFRSRLEGDAA